MGPFPLYKGATRVPVVLGVPVAPLVGLTTGVAIVTLFLGLYFWTLLVPAWLLLAQITRGDDRAFRILALWARTRAKNRLRYLVGGGNGSYWGASSYGTIDGRTRIFDGEELRWGG